MLNDHFSFNYYMALLRLIRLPNLFIVALTQWLLYQRIILPALAAQKILPTLPPDQFYLFIIITVLMTAGGYIINDIVDIKIDLLNKPERVIIGKRISIGTAYWLYFCLNLLGFLLSLYLAFVGNRMSLLFIFPTAIAGLYVYSHRLKKRPLSGNVLVSLYTAGVAFIVWIAEAPALSQLPASSLTRVTQLLTYYIIFAFFSNLFREIVKDLEDIQGDAATGALTVPIVWGIPTAKRLAGAAAILLLAYLLYFTATWLLLLSLAGKLALAALILMIALAIGLLSQARQIKQYHQLSQFTKFIMLWGILLLLLL